MRAASLAEFSSVLEPRRILGKALVAAGKPGSVACPRAGSTSGCRPRRSPALPRARFPSRARTPTRGCAVPRPAADRRSMTKAGRAHAQERGGADPLSGIATQAARPIPQIHAFLTDVTWLGLGRLARTGIHLDRSGRERTFGSASGRPCARRRRRASAGHDDPPDRRAGCERGDTGPQDRLGSRAGCTTSGADATMQGAKRVLDRGPRGSWRSERDSNPRDGLPPTHFPGVRLRPLGHRSVGGS